MSSIINPPAVHAPAVAAKTGGIISQWKIIAAERLATAEDHAVYALARVAHWGRNSDEVDETSRAFTLAALTKLVRTFGPVTNKTKISNDQHEFGALESALNSVRRGTFAVTRLNLEQHEFEDVRDLAEECFALWREIGIHEQRKLAPAQPAPRVKAPYVPS